VGVVLKDDKALERIRTLKPDVIIAEVERNKSGPEALLTKLLRKQPQAKVLRVSLEDNTATLYSARRWTADTVEELVEGMLTSVQPVRGVRKHASV
jgi:DNA-binding NarL/FixJ family response regulator